PDRLPAALRVQVEAAAWDRGKTDLPHHAVGEGHVRLVEPADVGHHVIGSVRRVALEAGAVQDLEQEVAPLTISVEQLDVVAVGESQGGSCRHLQRMGRSYGQEVVDLA